MTDTTFLACEHPGLNLSWASYALPNPDQPGGILYSVHIRVACPHCGANFQFLGNNAPAPMNTAEAQRERIGAFVTPDLAELGCMIAPMDPTQDLGVLAVKGRA